MDEMLNAWRRLWQASNSLMNPIFKVSTSGGEEGDVE